MDDLIRAAPDSALDADTFAVTEDLTVDDVEEVSSPPDVPQASRKRLRDSLPGPDPTAKRMRRISDWQGDIDRRSVRPDSVQEVGAFPTNIALGWFLTWGGYVGYRFDLQITFSTSLSPWKQ